MKMVIKVKRNNVKSSVLSLWFSSFLRRTFFRFRTVDLVMKGDDVPTQMGD